MTVWDHCCCLGYGLEARACGIWHLVRGHRLHWREHVDLWTGFTGAINCEACPDTRMEDGEHVGLAIWMRHWHWMMRVGQFVCGVLGHPGWKHPQQWSGLGDPCDDANMVDVEGEWFCVRCVTHKSATKPDAVARS